MITAKVASGALLFSPSRLEKAGMTDATMAPIKTVLDPTRLRQRIYLEGLAPRRRVSRESAV